MASDAQIVANRLNAQKSTGPRTAEGKAAVSQNAVKHGLLARQAVIVGEDPGEFAVYREQMLAELVPVGPVESVLAERVVGLSWRLRRAERLQNEAFDALYEKDTTSPFARLTQSLQSRGGDRAQRDPDAGEGDPAMGRAVVKDFGHAGVLDRLLMYERRIEHSLYRTMAELQRLRLLRETDRRAEDPTPEAKRRAIPEPATATEKRTSEPAGDGPDSPRQTKPIPESQCSGRPGPATQSPPPRETTPDHAKQTRFPGPLGRKPGADCVKQSQFAASRTRANSCLRSGLRQEGRRVAPRKQTQFAGLGWPLGGTCDGQGRQ